MMTKVQIVKKMDYKSNRILPPDLLSSGTYRGINFFVVTYGTHPCAYLEVGKTYLKGKRETDEGDLGTIRCHGGITFSEDSLCPYVMTGNDKWVVGWDYNHYGDFDVRWPDDGGRQWKTEEMVAECYDVIDQIRSKPFRNMISRLTGLFKF